MNGGHDAVPPQNLGHRPSLFMERRRFVLSSHHLDGPEGSVVQPEGREPAYFFVGQVDLRLQKRLLKGRKIVDPAQHHGTFGLNRAFYIQQE